MRVALAALRRVLFWSHLVLGVSAGLVILLMSVTGVLLGYERQVIAWVDGVPSAAVAPGAQRMPLDALLLRAGVAREEVASIALRTDPAEPVAIRFRDRDRAALLLDPYNGTSLAAPADSGARKTMAALRRWHRWIGAEAGALRTQMKAVTGASNLMFLLLVLSGIWLWWPKRLTVAALRNGLWFRRGLSPKARDFNWHNTIGFWTAIPLCAVVASGVFISYRWPGLWLDRLLGSPEERAAAIAAMAPVSGSDGRDGTGAAAGGRERGHDADRAPDGNDATDALAPLQAFVDVAAREVPAWRSLTLTLPAAGDRVVTAVAAEGNTYRPDLRTTLRLDAHDGALTEAIGYGALSRSRQIRAWVRFGHTGEVFGIAGQTVATLASLGGVFLVWTGLALSLRRLAAWHRRRRTPPPTAAASTPRRAVRDPEPQPQLDG
jgi:uncharacterized iron-regulated membrane protein